MEDAKQIGIQMAQLLGEPLADIAIAEFDSFDAILRDLNQKYGLLNHKSMKAF